MEAAYHFGLGGGRSYGNRTPRPTGSRAPRDCSKKPNDPPGKPAGFNERSAGQAVC